MKRKPTVDQRLLLMRMLLVVTLISSVVLNAQSPDPGRFKDSIEAFRLLDAKNSFPEKAVLFVGSSSIRMWHTATAFPHYRVINRGFGGSHISDVLFYLDDVVLKYKPKVIVFYAGDNDIAGDKTAERVLADYKLFTDKVWSQLPGTRVIFVPIKPSIKRWQLWPEMLKANQMIEKYSGENKMLHYADTISRMLETGSPPSADVFLDDGLHLSEGGYEMWNEVLMKILSETLNP